MIPTPPTRRRRHSWAWAAIGVALVLVAALGAVLVVSPGSLPRLSEPPQASPPTAQPVARPTSQADLQPVSAVLPAGVADADKVAAALQPLLSEPSLGPHVVVAVAPLASGEPIFTTSSRAFIPASTTKILTAAVGLHVLGPQHRFTTQVRRDGDTVTLVGGGDPFLMPRPATEGYPERADLTTLARQTARSIKREARAAGAKLPRLQLVYDDSIFTGPPIEPSWPNDYVRKSVVPPITALWVDQGRHGFTYAADPSREAAEAFREALEKFGLKVATPTHGRASPAATPVASVASAPLHRIVEQLLLVSDNNASEVLGHHIGLAVKGEGSFAAGAAAMREVLTQLGINMDGTVLHDASGLSRENRLTASALIDVLRLVSSPAQPHLRATVAGLPVAGFTGSLRQRFTTGPLAAKGLVRAKTGTLTGVHGLAGIAVDQDRTEFAFVVIADQVDKPVQLRARAHIDAIAAALGACSCGAVAPIS